MNIGLPPDQTLTEKALRFIGLCGCGLGILFMLISPLILFVPTAVSFLAPTIFIIGASGVVAGLCLTALSQALACLRLIAANS